MSLTKFELDKESLLNISKKDILDYLKEKNNLSFYKVKSIEKYLGKIVKNGCFNNSLFFLLEEENGLLSFYNELYLNASKVCLQIDENSFRNYVFKLNNSSTYKEKAYSRFEIPFSKDKLILAINDIKNQVDLNDYLNDLTEGNLKTLIDNYNTKQFVKYFEEFVNKIKPSLEIVYNNDFDIQIKNNKLYILLKEPDFIIENEEGDTTQIKNLIVELIFKYKDNSIVLDSFKSFKHIFENEEDILSGYVHSHCSANTINNLFYAKSFCTGGTDFTVFLENIKQREITSEEFDLLLYQIKEFLIWESEEGTPYIRFTDKGPSVDKYHRNDYENLEELDLIEEEIKKLLLVDSEFYEAFIKIDFDSPTLLINVESFNFLRQVFYKILLNIDVNFSVSYVKIIDNEVKYDFSSNYNILKILKECKQSFNHIPYEYFRDSKLEYSIDTDNFLITLIQNNDNYEPIASRHLLSKLKERFNTWKHEYTTEYLSRNFSIEEHIREDLFFVQ